MSMQTLAAPQSRSLHFTDSAACERWVEQLPLTNIQQVQRLLNAQLAALHAADLPALERLKILEALRQPTTIVQGECAKRYVGKPLPLDAEAAATWRDTIGLWDAIAQNYRQCLAAYRAGDLVVAPHAAAITARLMQLIGCQMIEHYRVYRLVPGELWTELHALYVSADQCYFRHMRVADPLRKHASDSSCDEIYMRVLLAHLANPYGLSPNQFGFVWQWLDTFAGLATLSQEPPPALASPALAVDLDGVAGPTFASVIDPASDLRYLDVEELAKTLREMMITLQQGNSPTDVGLDGNAPQTGCENLLKQLYMQWCRAGTCRAEEREAADEDANIVFGISAAHRQLNGGREFRQNGELTSREKRDFDTFGFLFRTQQAVPAVDELPLEACRIGNSSPSGFMCVLREPRGPGRIFHNQIILVRRGGRTEPRIGIIQWLQVEANGDLRCGVRLFPGKPQAVMVHRPSDVKQVADRHEPALLLEADTATATPATLVLPAGWFQCGAFIEVATKRHRIATMLNLLEKSSDFDRGTVKLI